jgi:hypothetical protein
MPKFSVLPSTDPLDGAEVASVVQAGTSKKTLLSTIRTWLASTFATGPSSSTDNAIVRFDSTTGKLLKDSSVTIANTTGEVGSGGLYKTTVSNGSSAVGFILDTQNDNIRKQSSSRSCEWGLSRKLSKEMDCIGR